MTSRVNGDGSEAEAAMLSAFLYLHRQKQNRAERAQPNPRYARVLDHFQTRARRLQDERVVTEEVIERVLEGGKRLPPRPAQQELELVGVAGGTAAGRVRIRNRSERLADFELCIGQAVAGAVPVAIECQPPRGALAAGDTALVRVAADLGRFRAGDSVTVPIECRWRTGHDYLWLVIRADSEERRSR